MVTKITREVLEGYLSCRLKGHLTFRGEIATRSEYRRLLDRTTKYLRDAAEDLVKARFPEAHDAMGTAVGSELHRPGLAAISNGSMKKDLLSIGGRKPETGARSMGLSDCKHIPRVWPLLQEPVAEENPAVRLEACLTVEPLEMFGRSTGR